MFIQEVSIEVPASVDKEQAVEGVYLLMIHFRKSGQIQSKNPPQFIQGGRIVCIASTLEENSLEVRYNNLYVNRQIKKVEDLCGTKLSIRTMGKTSESYQGPCQCQESQYYILFTTFLTVESPIICGSCYKTVPLYRIPYYHAHEYLPILSWEGNYQACDTLQIYCEVGERWATQQLSNYTSQLSKQGRKICETIEEQTGKPTYYYLCNYRAISKKRDKERACPSCGQIWELNEPLHELYEFKCDNCRLISTINQCS